MRFQLLHHEPKARIPSKVPDITRSAASGLSSAMCWRKFNVAFIPVTCHLACPVTDYIFKIFQGRTDFSATNVSGLPRNQGSADFEQDASRLHCGSVGDRAEVSVVHGWQHSVRYSATWSDSWNRVHLRIGSQTFVSRRDSYGMDEIKVRNIVNFSVLYLNNNVPIVTR